ncbi:MAG TPA: CDGSH iron-sulfur domain-containing protein [Nitrososphaera sp.]|jgi:CDGSH-type Zn-finger protein
MVNVEIKSSRDGPNLIVVDGKVTVALCRCGGSSNKPLCDGTHRKINFKAEEKTTKIA